MKRICSIAIMIVFFALNAVAQNSGDVVVHTDPRLSVLLKKKHIVMKAHAAKARHAAEDHIASDTHNATPAAAAQPQPAGKAPQYIIREREGKVIYSGKGFRVQIYSGADREKAIKMKVEFMRRFPGVRTYLTYSAPSFRVKVGNYRNRSDAAGMLRRAKSMYNTPCVIVPDIITINTF